MRLSLVLLALCFATIAHCTLAGNLAPACKVGECDDHNLCTRDWCDELNGCVHDPVDCELDRSANNFGSYILIPCMLAHAAVLSCADVGETLHNGRPVHLDVVFVVDVGVLSEGQRTRMARAYSRFMNGLKSNHTPVRAPLCLWLQAELLTQVNRCAVSPMQAVNARSAMVLVGMAGVDATDGFTAQYRFQSERLDTVVVSASKSFRDNNRACIEASCYLLLTAILPFRGQDGAIHESRRRRGRCAASRPQRR